MLLSSSVSSFNATSLKTWQIILSETINLLKNLHFLFATTSEGVWQPNICLHISTTSWERVEKIILKVLFMAKSIMLCVTVFDDLRPRSPAASSQLPSVIRCARWRQLVRPTDSTSSPSLLSPHHLSTDHDSHHHHHRQHVDHRTYYHLNHHRHYDADDDNEDDDDAAAWAISDMENRRLDTGINILAKYLVCIDDVTARCIYRRKQSDCVLPAK